jgi:hypothetical protein
MAGMLQMRRSRGAVSGFLLILLGLWGALIPFIGPYFHYAYTPDTAWHYSTARLWLEILPGAAVFLGGFLLLIAKTRHTALFGALLAAAAGAWFALGTTLSPLWNNNVPMGGSPASPHVYTRIMEELGFFYALGVVIVFIAAAAFGRILSVPSGIRAVEPVTETVPAETVPAESVPAETVSAEGVPAETVPIETVPAREVATSGLPMRKVVARDVPADAAPARDTSTEDTRTIS